MRASRLLVFLALLTALAGLASIEHAQARGVRERVVVLGRGKPWETRATIREGPEDGPTVMILGGVHGNEPAGADAAEQILGWELARGRLVVLPRANVLALAAGERLTPGAPKTEANLNRNYPREDGEQPRGELARAIWGLVEDTEPDWLLDLHEGYSTHAQDRKSFGHTIIYHPDREEVREVAGLMVAAVNRLVYQKERRYVKLEQLTPSTLVRSAGDRLGVRTLLLETCYGAGPRSRRIRRHRTMVALLLSRLEMLPEGVGVDTLLPARRTSSEMRVAVYDAEGTGGAGVPKVFEQVGPLERTTLRRVCPEDIRAGVLTDFDVVTFTGGTGRGQARALKESGRKRVREFVHEGGGYVGVCGGAYLAISKVPFGLGILDARVVSSKWQRGRGTPMMELTREGRRRLSPKLRRSRVVYHNGPVFEPAGSDDLPDYKAWAVYQTEVVGGGAPKRVMVGSPAIVGASYGKGRVVVIGPHPEQTRGLEQVLPCSVRWAARR